MFTVGCTTAPPVDPLPTEVVFSRGDIETAVDGRCFATTRGPDQFETVVDQVQVVAERRDVDGSLISPAIYRNQARRVSIPSTDISRFETICPPRYTEPFVLSLQRALAARNAYNGPINGQLDAETTRAIQLYQLERGLNAALMSVVTAQELGLIVVPSQ